MKISYGRGQFVEGATTIDGDIVLSEHKLYLRDGNKEIAPTFIPLEKIQRIKLRRSVLDVQVRPNVMTTYVAEFHGDQKNISALASEIVQRRKLKKRFLIKEWLE